MGMYDNVLVKQKLPLSEELSNISIDWTKVVFQTKDLENCLSDYIITEDGDLMVEHVECEYVYYTEEERKQRELKPWDLVKETIEKSRTTQKIEYHGKILFYTHETFSDTEDVWVDFEAYFIYGKLDKLVLAKVEKYPSSKIQNEKWFKQMEEEKNAWSYKLKKRVGWFVFWKSVTSLCTFISRVFQDINTYIYKHIL